MRDILMNAFASRVVPVAVIHDANHAIPMVEALARGGLNCVEITMRTEASLEAIVRAATCENTCIGAGTVLSVEQVDAAIDAGAQFIVTPGFNPGVVRHCLDRDIDVVPGVCTPTEIEAAMELGIRVFKFFPAEAMGGLKTLRAISGPYQGIRFMPTGGITPNNLGEYLGYERILACGGSWMVSPELMAAEDWESITALTEEAVACARRAGAGE